MKTIAFYSYKGGVGRTLALSNIAMRLSDFNKKVCVLDLDFEAPGVHYKFRKMFSKTTVLKQGIVDCIYDFAVNQNLPKSLADYAIELPLPYHIRLIPAGDPDSSGYWKKLSGINWNELFYNEKSEGIPFFFYLKEKIEKEFHPDYLLIDTPTGITDISSLTISLLADQVVLLAANNEENISGCKRIIRSLLSKDNNLLNKNRELILALTRIPFPNTPEDRAREKIIIENFNKNFSDISALDGLPKSWNESPVLIHSDREVECNEEFKIGYDFEVMNNKKIIAGEYLNLFGEITKNDFTAREKNLFEEEKKREKIYYNLRQIENSQEAITLIGKYLETYPEDDYLYYLLALNYRNNTDYDLALEAIKRAMEFEPWDVYRQLCAYLYFSLHRYEEAFQMICESDNELDKIFMKAYLPGVSVEEIEKEADSCRAEHVNTAEQYNHLACIYRKSGNLAKATECIYKALELDSTEPCFYSTLAEIMADRKDDFQFYFNIEMALKYNMDLRVAINESRDVYERYIHQEKFIDLLKRYDKNKVLDYITQLFEKS